jgi:hypothetical protein
MAARRQPDHEDNTVNRFGQADEEAIQRYLHLTDDGEIARLAAMMTPPKTVMNARALVAQAAALQVEAAAELVRQREVMVESMSLATLSELAGRLGVDDLGFLHLIDEDNLGDNDPIRGPVLRRLASLMSALPPPQDFHDLFLAEKPTDALNRASSRTSLRRPLPDATLEELLRFAANIPEDEASWDILNGAFIDFLRMWFQDRLDLEELIQGGSDAGPKKSKSSSVVDRIEKLQRKRSHFYESFKPGHEFPPNIVELAHRAYTECWEGGILGPQWLRRFAWLADEFPPFWEKFGDAYCALEADAKATLKKRKQERSAQKSEAGEVGRQRREGNRLRKVTAGFIEFLIANRKDSEGGILSSHIDAFVEVSPILGKKQDRANTLEFVQALCTAVTNDLDARTVLDTLQRSQLAKIEALEPTQREQHLNKLPPNQRNQYLEKGTIPPKWVQFKCLTEEAVSDCLEDLKHALSKACPKKNKK